MEIIINLLHTIWMKPACMSVMIFEAYNLYLYYRHLWYNNAKQDFNLFATEISIKLLITVQ